MSPVTDAIIARDNPDLYDTVCIHLYPGDEWLSQEHSVTEVLGTLSSLAREQGRPLVLGEFGVPRKLGSLQEQGKVFQSFLDGIVANRAPLSAFWVFAYGNQDDSWNITPTNDRAFLLTMAAKANTRLQQVPAK